MHAVPIPRKVHSVCGNVHVLPLRVALAQAVDGHSPALRAVVISPHFAHGQLQFSVAAVEAPVGVERAPLGLLHRHVHVALLVAGVDQIAAVNHALHAFHLAAAGLGGDFRAGEFVQPFDEPCVDVAGSLVHLRGVFLVREVMRIAREQKRRAFLLRRGGFIGGEQRAQGEEPGCGCGKLEKTAAIHPR